VRIPVTRNAAFVPSVDLSRPRLCLSHEKALQCALRDLLGIEYETRATNPLIGHWWGFFVPMIPGLVLFGGLLSQFQIYDGECAKGVRGRADPLRLGQRNDCWDASAPPAWR
jgi:hypothetical protein